MPRIVPLQLLKCLKVLLDDNGGILSESEVKRIAGLMTKYSKKLVSKCIYVQILKCTKTELLGEFMGSGGWSLTHTWLNDAIRARNWPLVQEILELLLLCPVDVERLKSNSAPKLVKGLCKDGDDEGVRILASKLVEQWLKVVTGDATTSITPQMAPKSSELNAVAAPTNVSSLKSESNAKQAIKKQVSTVEEDPLGATEPTIEGSYQPTLAQKKASESGLVLKCIVKDGKQVWARVENTPKNSAKTESVTEKKSVPQQQVEIVSDDNVTEEEPEVKEASPKPAETVETVVSNVTKSSNDTTDNKDNESSSKKKEILLEKEKSLEKEKEKEKEKSKSSSSSDKDKKSSSSSHKSSSSSHKSSSSSKSSSGSSSSSSSKSKSSHRSSTDSKSRDKDKERDKERSSNKERSSDKDKHRSSSSKSSSSSSSKDKDRHRDKSSSSSSSSSTKKDKEKEKSDPAAQAEKDKDTLSKLSTPSIDKLGKIPKKPKDDALEVKPTSITIPSKKASMSIEIRRDSEKAKTVKTYKSQFRSHGLTEEAPPPPSRKGLKKPNSAPVPGTAIPSTLTLKRASPPPSSLSTSLNKDAPVEKKAKIEMAALAVPVVEKIGAIKLIPPKKSFIIICDLAMVWILLILRRMDNRWDYHQQQLLVRG